MKHTFEQSMGIHKSEHDRRSPLDATPWQIRRYKAHFALEGDASWPGFLCTVTMGVTVLASTVLFLYASRPDFEGTSVVLGNYPTTLLVLDAIANGIFQIEYIARLVTAPRWYRWIFHPWSIMDLLALFPYYVNLFISTNVSALAVFRVLRLFRLFAKLGQFSPTFAAAAVTVKRSRDGFVLLVMVVALLLVAFSSLMFYAEQVGRYGQTFDHDTKLWVRYDGSPSPFQSVPDVFWWAIVTITTVGYGDMYPVNELRKTVAAAAMICGMMVMSFPIAIFSTNFTDVWREMKAKKQAQLAEQRRHRQLHQRLTDE
eukprot:TRINITY_DN24208_c0_g1_i1.p1 TRINITY_DN24208_c0_g1~~TRINITY_DN24208_c0_g1_i1.p1  ORF type:complete len:314 (-),score=45.62 TRINITY_DN24208_c0_g1_i1:34-975(-)